MRTLFATVDRSTSIALLAIVLALVALVQTNSVRDTNSRNPYIEVLDEVEIEKRVSTLEKTLSGFQSSFRSPQPSLQTRLDADVRSRLSLLDLSRSELSDIQGRLRRLEASLSDLELERTLGAGR